MCVYSCWRHPRAPGSFVGLTGVQGSRLWCWCSLWMLGKMMLLVSRVCFMWHYKQIFWGFWGVMLTFVADARENDVVGVTRLLHVVTGFLGGSGVWCWSSLWMLEKMMLLVSRVCFMWHYKQVFGGFWGVMLMFVVDAREDGVVGVTRLLHVALTGFLGGSGVWCWRSLWMLEKMMLLVSGVCFTWHKQGFGSDWQRPKRSTAMLR